MNKIEQKYSYQQIQEKNKLIAEILAFEPKIEWVVENKEKGSICYSPNYWGLNFIPADQKIECEKWLNENIKNKVSKRDEENIVVAEKKYWPIFHDNWELLIKAIVKLEESGINIKLSTHREEVWNSVYEMALFIKENSVIVSKRN